jgi:hypothetical protein
VDPIDRILEAILVVATILAILVLVLLVIFLIIEVGDRVGPLEIETGTGVVVSKEFIPAHTAFIPAGKIIIPVRHPDSWSVTVRVDGSDKTVKVGVEEGFFNAVNPDETWIGFDFTRGRITGRILIEKIWIIER